MNVTDFSKYQQEAMKTRMPDTLEHTLTYSALGLAGEAGELANKVKKIMRGDTNRDELLEGIRSEMGDVLWYLAALAQDLGADLSEIAEENLVKIRDRQARGKIAASGDKR